MISIKIDQDYTKAFINLKERFPKEVSVVEATSFLDGERVAEVLIVATAAIAPYIVPTLHEMLDYIKYKKKPKQSIIEVSVGETKLKLDISVQSNEEILSTFESIWQKIQKSDSTEEQC